MMLRWVLAQRALCALLIAPAGLVLSRSADRLAVLRVGWFSVCRLSACVVNATMVYLSTR